ncbi:MAG TPA: CusA/CzcA family heavy metal efflux RND transporter [Bacteroidales bacterium]|nr:CusA/CzcA family heavy metal efflux RND transporter [Bacteroidales bacterium]HOX73986.1 CusA/CzcA family heavy metal efflux RND transporter [Bacteroidales bacterium]HPM87705.1 CusA/CzcA family heavy metal efflux RND transporter [Bacteroidales bacterium]HQM69976.1 CusA/CzcA family heavy metal efflux RND transporter [Bacteroidales bacterium]
MERLFSFFINRRVLIATCFVLVGAIGIYSWFKLPIDAYPDIADVTVQVVTQVPGLAAEEIEQQITIPLERELNGLPGLQIMRSKNLFSISSILLVFRDGTDDYWARQRVQERINLIELPFGAIPELNPLTSPTGEVCRYIIESSERPLRELTDLQKWVIIPRLKQVMGVADVQNFGGITTQYQIEIDPLKLEKYNITLGEVVESINSNNANAGGSMLNRGDLTYIIREVGLIKDLDDLGKIVVKSTETIPIFLSDLGTLKYGNFERKGVFGYSDREREYSESVQGIVQLLRYENPSNVLEEVHRAIDELNNDILPEDVNIHIFLDRTHLVNATLNTVSHTLLFGVLLVIGVLIIFLGSWRSALVIAITIPLSLLIAFIFMYFTDIQANLLSLGAIDFGIIVEGSIVMLETVLKKREDNPLAELQKENIVKRCVEMGKPIFFSMLIIIMAYMPLFTFERIEKKMFSPMAYTVAFAILGALAVALMLIPGLAFAIYRKPQKVYHNKWLEKITILYRRFTERLLEKPKKIFLPLGVIFLGTILLSITVGKDFLPTLDEGSLWLQVQFPPGITLEKSKEMADTLRSHLMKYEEVQYVMTQVGRDDEGTDPFSTSHAECGVGLIPYKEWKKGKRKNDLINELTEDLAKLPGYSVGFSQPIIDMVMDQIAGSHSDLAIKIFGEDQEEARRIAEEIVEVIRGIKGAGDVSIEQEPPLPQLQIETNRDKMALYGLNVSDVSDLIEIAIGGKAISQVFIGNRVYDIICRYNEQSRETSEKIGSLLMTSATGARIPLSQIAEIRTTKGPGIINREENSRFLTVRINMRDRDISSFLKEAGEAIEKNISYDHTKFNLKWSGQFDNQKRAFARLILIVPLSLALMFLLLFWSFGYFRQAWLQLALLPFPVFGGMVALNITGMSFNVSSAVGFIALFGIFTMNDVLMISHFNHLRKEGESLKNAVIKGSTHRFRQILMTSSVAILGLVPASLSTNIGSDVQRPLATVIVYGLIFGTIITLTVLPPLYYMMEKRYLKKQENKTKEIHEKNL